jgi:hypothetical protein
MSLRIVLFGISFLVMMCGCLVGNLSYYSMIGEINKRRPTDKQISTWGFNRWRSFDHIQEYRLLYPSGRLLLRYKLGLTAMIAGFFSTAFCLFWR